MDNITFITPVDSDGQRLDAACVVFSDLSRAKIQKLLASGNISVNSFVVSKANTKIRADDVVVINIPTVEPSHISAKQVDFTIVYEDEHLIVIDKPAGLVVHPGNGNQDNTLVSGLLHHCQENLSSIGGAARPGIVHRLDKDTSGLMVIAKNDFAHTELSKQISQRSAQRVYKAIVWGMPVKTNDIIETYISRSRIDRLRMRVTRGEGKIAITQYTVVQVLAGGVASLLECKLGTGRTHQIRVHMSHIGHSIIGDQTYGHNARKINKYHLAKDAILALKRQALHSCKLSFVHPVTQENMTFESPLPEDLCSLLDSINHRP